MRNAFLWRWNERTSDIRPCKVSIPPPPWGFLPSERLDIIMSATARSRCMVSFPPPVYFFSLHPFSSYKRYLGSPGTRGLSIARNTNPIHIFLKSASQTLAFHFCFSPINMTSPPFCIYADRSPRLPKNSPFLPQSWNFQFHSPFRVIPLVS